MVTAKGHDTRRRLLDAATDELLSSNGDVELTAVARRAQVSSGAPYRHFKSKSELMRTLVEDFYDRFDRAVFRPDLAEVGDWRARELTRTRQFVRFSYDDRAAPVLLSLLAGDAEVMRAQASRIERAKVVAAKNVERGQREGAIPSSLDPVLAGAAVIGGLLHGVTLGLSQRIPRARVETAMCRFMISALELDREPPKRKRRS